MARDMRAVASGLQLLEAENILVEFRRLIEIVDLDGEMHDASHSLLLLMILRKLRLAAPGYWRCQVPRGGELLFGQAKIGQQGRKPGILRIEECRRRPCCSDNPRSTGCDRARSAIPARLSTLPRVLSHQAICSGVMPLGPTMTRQVEKTASTPCSFQVGTSASAPPTRDSAGMRDDADLARSGRARGSRRPGSRRR